MKALSADEAVQLEQLLNRASINNQLVISNEFSRRVHPAEVRATNHAEDVKVLIDLKSPL